MSKTTSLMKKEKKMWVKKNSLIEEMKQVTFIAEGSKENETSTLHWLKIVVVKSKMLSSTVRSLGDVNPISLRRLEERLLGV